MEGREMQETLRKKYENEISTRIDDEEYTKQLQVHDSSLDYKGRLPNRASTGSWKASFFILAIQFCEIMSYFGIATNMITYMSQVMHQDLKSAANSVNLWSGVATVMPLLGAFLADAYVGRYSMILFSAILYVLVLSMLTMIQYIPSLKPCNTTSNSCKDVSKVHKIVFFIAIYLLTLAMGGYKPCLESFGADQFDDNHSKERKQKMSFFNWWNIVNCCGLFVGVTLIVYVQVNVSWGIGFLILAITMAFTIFIFVLGRPSFRYSTALGSPFTPLFQVLVAAIAKRNLPCPSNPDLLYEDFDSENKLQGRFLSHTNRIRFLDKAAIIEENASINNNNNRELPKKKQNPWKLATVTKVEELKLLITMIPIWLTFLMFGISNAQGPTFYIKQGMSMNRKIFKHFEIPAPSMAILASLGTIATVTLYDKLLLPYLRKVTRNERGINMLTRISVGMIITIISMVISALVERERLKSSLKGKNHHILLLAPQVIMVGVGDGFALVAMQEFFYEQVPDAMRSLGIAFYLSVIGVGNFLTSFLIVVVDFVSGLNGGKRWIGKDVNHSRLDYYYWFLSIIFVLNFCVFVFLSKNYRYKNVQRSVVVKHSCVSEEKVDLTNV